MGMYFRCYGYLKFENDSIAKQNFELLTTTKDSYYSFSNNELELVDTKITFKAFGNFCSYSTSEATCDLLFEVAGTSYNGDVRIDEGDGEKSLWSWRLYKVRAKTLYYDHTKPKKSFRFKGELEFENEELAKNACKLLATDIKNSLFAKNQPPQIVFADDRRKISFQKNVLHIDVHCPGDSKDFTKTRNLISKLKAISGEVKCEETVCLRYIPAIGHSSLDWVNDMSKNVFYHFSGFFSFNTQKEAEAALTKLLSTPASLFLTSAKKAFPLYASGTKLYFNDRGNCSRDLLEKTEKLIYEIGSTALRGKVEKAFSIFENMDVYVIDSNVPSKIRASIKATETIAKRKNKKK